MLLTHMMQDVLQVCMQQGSSSPISCGIEYHLSAFLLEWETLVLVPIPDSDVIPSSNEIVCLQNTRLQDLSDGSGDVLRST